MRGEDPVADEVFEDCPGQVDIDVDGDEAAQDGLHRGGGVARAEDIGEAPGGDLRVALDDAGTRGV